MKLKRFKVTPERLQDISEKFDVTLESVQLMYDKYLEILHGLKYQYLAHAIRTVEIEVRKQPGFELFQIQCVPVENNSLHVGFGSAQYYDKNLYIIYYDALMDEKQLRVVIAHELGHLVVEVLMMKELNSNKPSEPLSSIFGVLSILDKNDFYHSKASSYKHTSSEEIIADFLLLRNRSSSKHNTSQ